MTREAAEGMTETLAIRFCTVSLHVTRRPFHSLAVSFAMSSPIFLGDRPRGPIFGANDDAAPTSPPVALTYTSTTCEGSNLGAIAAFLRRQNAVRSRERTKEPPPTASESESLLMVTFDVKPNYRGCNVRAIHCSGFVGDVKAIRHLWHVKPGALVHRHGIREHRRERFGVQVHGGSRLVQARPGC